MTRRNDTLYKILTRKYDFCCLCHREVQENPIQIKDEIVIKNNEGEITLKVLDILGHILDHSVYNIVAAFHHVCKKCTSSAVKAYKFLKTAKENSELINNCINSLTENLENSNNYFNSTKSMFITYNTQNFKCQQYYDHYKINSTSAAIKRLNILLEPHSGNLDIKAEPNYLEFEIPIKPGIARKSKRKHYADSVSLKTSEMLHNKNDQSIIKCKACLKIYPSLSNLRNHFIRVHAPKKYKCSMCSKKFGSLSLVEAHETESHCTIVCKECGKTFNNRHSLKIHEIGHYLRIVCPDCGRVYKSQSTYKKHIDLNICGQKTRASPQNAKFTCDYCNKKYTQKVSLRVHIQYEHGNYKSHECKWCKKKFFAQSRLKAHIVKHTKEKKFSCTTCGGKFVSKESLLYHTRTHTGEKPFKCEFCDKRFLSSSRRTDHRKHHHSNATFQCKVCNIKYSTQTCLQKHMKIHDGQEKDMYVETNEKVNNVNELSEDFHLDEINIFKIV